MTVQSVSKQKAYFADQYPDLIKGPVPVKPYISPEYFELEREYVFKRNWLNVAREEELPNPGDCLVKDIAVLKTSVLLVRGADHKIRAFHNICRHRGNKLVYKEGPSHANNFTCRFHGWVYGSTGQLLNIPAEDDYYAIDKSCYGLIPLGCDSWEGFVFIHYDPKPTVSLRDFLGEIATQYTGYPFSQMQQINSYAAIVKGNWKTAADAFQEAHHVPYIHGITMGDAFTSEENPHCHITWAKLYAQHRSGSVYGAPQQNRKLFPTERAAFSQLAAFTQGADDSGSNLPGVNPANIGNWAFDINVIFPHFFLDPGNGQYFTMHFWPIDYHTTRWEFRLYMFPTSNAAQKIAQKYTDVVMRDAAVEDLSTIEATQKALESEVLDVLPYSDQELMLRHNLSVIAKAVRSGGAALPKRT